MKKRMLSMLLALCLVMTLLPTAVYAAEGDTDTTWYTDSATEFTISTVAQLKGLASLVNSGNTFENITIKLGDDIDLGGEEWAPIGSGKRSDSSYTSDSKVFKGTFDGDNHTISNLKISSCTNADAALGLFGVVDGGTVKNLKLENVNISTTNNKNTGAAIGLMVGGATAENITVSGTVSGADGVGGIVGRMTIEGTIKNCTNNATVTATKSSGCAGGIIGKAYYTATGKAMNISGCKNTGIITSAYAAGGIAAFSAANVSGCTNTAAITAGNTGGGIVGEQTNYGTISDNNNTGAVSNKTDSVGDAYGGIVGWIRYQISDESYPLTETIVVSGNTNSGVISAPKSKLGTGGIVGSAYNQATVTGNENKAESITGGAFTAGILAGAQIENGNKKIESKTIQAYNNVSSTAESGITGVVEEGSTACVTQYMWNNNPSTFKAENNSTAWVAQIGTTRYATLAAAIDAAASGDTITMIADVPDAEGISVAEGKNFTIDFAGHTYTVNKPGAGSKNTETNGFQLLKNSTITFKNGKMNIGDGNRDLTGDAAKRAIKILIQNYCNLTLDNMEIDGTNLCVAQYPYTVSNNCGEITIKDTTITAADNCWAFDVFASSGADYHAVKVTVINSTINGKIDVARSSKDAAANHINTLVIQSGTINGEISVADHENSHVSISGGSFNGALTVNGNENKTVSITGGTFTTDPSEYVADGYEVKTNSDGTYGVKPESSAVYVPTVSTYAISVSDAEHGSVAASAKSAAAGATVTVTVTPDEGYVLETLSATDAGGNTIEVTNLGDGKYSFKMPAAKVTVTATFMDDNTMLNFFVDVPAEAYYYDAVLWAAKNGITTGVDETHFAPNRGCTRAQLAALLYRYAQSQGKGFTGAWMFQLPFTDVPELYYEAVAWCYMNGIVLGYSDDQFGSQDIVTRQQTVAILYRFAEAMGYDVSVGEDTNILSFNDALTVSEYATEAFQWATGAGIVQGNNGNLLPKDTCTRGQLVAILYRMLGE